ncbi:MAG: PKD domain-containing protein [Bacteroidetes bacterium]|nr:PKD domain-containing protein [Bacteroidota bacterium]
MRLRLISLLIPCLLSLNLAYSQTIQSSTIVPSQPMSCQDMKLACTVVVPSPNYDTSGVYFTVVGSIITVHLNYFVQGISLPVITTRFDTVEMGMILAGTYTMNIITYRNWLIIDTDSLSVTVQSCCTSATADFTPGDMTICLGDSIEFINSSIGADSYIWFVNGQPWSIDTNYTHTFNSLGNYAVALHASDTNCTDIKTVTMTVLPHIGFNPWGYTSNLLDFDFTNNSTDVTTYLWDFGDGNTSTDPSPMHSFAVSDTYNVCQTVMNGCDSIVISFDLAIPDRRTCEGRHSVLVADKSGAVDQCGVETADLDTHIAVADGQVADRNVVVVVQIQAEATRPAPAVGEIEAIDR